MHGMCVNLGEQRFCLHQGLSQSSSGGIKERWVLAQQPLLTHVDDVLRSKRLKLGHDIVPQCQIEDAERLDVDLCSALQCEHPDVLLENRNGWFV